MSAALIVLGDTTDHGGEVISAAPAATAGGKPIARIGDLVSCPRCGGEFAILQGNPEMEFDGAAAAYDGCAVACGAKLIASQSDMTTWPSKVIHPPRRYFSFDLEDEPAPVVAAPAPRAVVSHTKVSATLYFRNAQTAALKEALRLLANHRARLTHADGTANALNWLQFSLPRQFVTTHPATFQALFVDCARLLKAERGTGGFAEGQAVDWLTAVDARIVAAAGGLPALRSALPRDWFAKYDYGNGIVIQAGPVPIEPDATHFLLLGAALNERTVPDHELLQSRARLLSEPKLAAASTLPEIL